MFSDLNNTGPISRGIHYYANERGIFFRLRRDYLNQHKVETDGFIIGVIENNVLRPIYDQNHRMVVVRRRDDMNIPLDPFHIPRFPFHIRFPSSLRPVNPVNAPPRHNERRRPQPEIEDAESSNQRSYP